MEQTTPTIRLTFRVVVTHYTIVRYILSMIIQRLHAPGFRGRIFW